MFALPNITLEHSIESEFAALCSTNDPRIQRLAEQRPAFATFYRKFTTEFGAAVAPSFILCRPDAPNSYKTVSAMRGFRDLVAMSIIPKSWAHALRWDNPRGVFYSDLFSVYPWMLDKNYEHLVTYTMAMHGMHDVAKLRPQSIPAVPVTYLSPTFVDDVLLSKLLSRWEFCFSTHAPAPEDVRLFRSLNMAFAASQMPASTDVTEYDLGRSVAIWVSAFEILAPAEQAAYRQMYQLLEGFDWKVEKNKTAVHSTYDGKKNRADRILPCWIYGEIYHARNDYLHGNALRVDRLIVPSSGRSLTDYTAPLYRMALAAYTGIDWVKPLPSIDEPAEFGKYISEHMSFTEPQRDIEVALTTVLQSKNEIRAERQAAVAAAMIQGRTPS